MRQEAEVSRGTHASGGSRRREGDFDAKVNPVSVE